MDTLGILHKSLCQKVGETFPQFKDRRPVNRQVKHTVLPDIVHLGNSLANGQAFKDLDKIFACKEISTDTVSNSTDGQGTNVPTSVPSYTDLFDIVVTLRDRLKELDSESLGKRIENLESEIADLKKACTRNNAEPIVSVPEETDSSISDFQDHPTFSKLLVNTKPKKVGGKRKKKKKKQRKLKSSGTETTRATGVVG